MTVRHNTQISTDVFFFFFSNNVQKFFKICRGNLYKCLIEKSVLICYNGISSKWLIYCLFGEFERRNVI